MNPTLDNIDYVCIKKVMCGSMYNINPYTTPAMLLAASSELAGPIEKLKSNSISMMRFTNTQSFLEESGKAAGNMFLAQGKGGVNLRP